MKSLLEIEEQLDLSEWERDLGRKRTKAGKYFWYIVLLNIHKNKSEGCGIDLDTLVKSYGLIFYCDYKLLMDSVENFEGRSQEDLKNVNFQKFEQHFDKRKNAVWSGLIDAIFEFYGEYKSYLSKPVDAAGMEWHSLTFLDGKRNELPQISRQYKNMLYSFDSIYLDDKTILDSKALFKPNRVKNLSGMMDQVYLSYLLERAANTLKKFKATGNSKFNPKQTVSTATEAVEYIATTESKLMQLPNSELKYIIEINFQLPGGESFDEKFLQSLSKAIRRYKKKHKKCQILPSIVFRQK